MKLMFMLTCLGLVQSASIKHPEKNSCSDVISYHFAAFSSKCRYNPDVLSDIPSMSERHGYNSIAYSLTTQDGYILKIFRIRAKTFNARLGPVFLFHGVVIDSASWTSTANRSLAFNLVNQGYDVWVGTFRGSLCGNQHRSLTVNDPEFWNFNIDVIAQFDVPVQLNFIANITGEKVVILAHSMGTTLSFMYTSEYSNEANKLIKGIVALAPVVYLDGVLLAELVEPWGIPLLKILGKLNIKGVLLFQEKIVHRTLTSLCKGAPELCFFLVSTMPGISKLVAPDDLLLYFSYWPSGTSVYVVEQFLQITRSKQFQKFDFNKFNNKKRYGTVTAPTYNLRNVQVPVALFYGKHDVFFKEKNIERLYHELGTSRKYKLAVPANDSIINGFSHTDFLFSRHIQENLYKDLFSVLKAHFD